MFTVAIALQLVDNFTCQLAQTKEILDNFKNNVKRTEKQVKSFGEALRKAFDPNVLRQFSEKLEDISLQVAQATALPLSGLHYGNPLN
ncbi:MAG: hypothetical protein N2327_06420 [Caldimicrobium sp.]|nr:hypothetical protein [Caldimicrobium sp.]MCX7874046.1 hypothetical protein [Caldimicrobium sp.]MDW8093870.1 hypothetical protein [Caldimicrobium sp.]